ncbi:MAG: twin-arginine translocase subunit TatB [Gammaproteobacteria bacterium]|nr:twin-arginine translocase subunit TatB [Gammaproteobacteria bacterium]|tara:strand:- start:1084 stop:1809 length:726 start_codon:yes stop_codon:yes gene_type:complete
MFDIGFMELLLIGIVALLVLGPDKLPGAIRTGALWFGRAKRSFNNVKSEIEQQINADEIRRQLHNESILGDIEKAKKNANKLIEDTQSEIRSTEDSVKRSINPDNKSGARTQATTSADEGMPTPPPADYKAPSTSGTRSAPDQSATSPKTTVAPATENPQTDAQAAGAQATDEKAGVSVESATQAGPETDLVPEGDKTKEQSTAAQDIYSTPPSGIVSMQQGKFSAVNDKPKNSDSSSGKN